MPKSRLPYLSGLIRKLAPRAGAKVVIEPEWGAVGQIRYKNGIVRAFHFYSLDLNPLASAKIAKDKHFAKLFIQKAGYPVAPGQTFFEESWARTVHSQRGMDMAETYARKLGYPVIAKPNDKSQGEGVVLAHNADELRKALREIFQFNRVALVERYQPGRDYRVVVLDGKIISAYERLPLSVTGNGRSTLDQLLRAKLASLKADGRQNNITEEDWRIKNRLKNTGYTLKSVPSKDERIVLLDNANLSSGGEARDVTRIIHSGYKKIATEVTKKMGLRLSGVDLMVTRGDITDRPERSRYYIIEINAAPGLDHYVAVGQTQRKIVEAMYLKVLRALGKNDRVG